MFRMTPRRIFDLLAWSTFVGIGALQMKQVRGGFITSYGADLVCPGLLYVLARRGTMFPFNRLGIRPEPVLAAVCILTPCFVWELLQLFDLSGTPLVITRGHFDPLDLVSYTVGVAIPLVADILSRNTVDSTGRPSQVAAIFSPENAPSNPSLQRTRFARR